MTNGSLIPELIWQQKHLLQDSSTAFPLCYLATYITEMGGEKTPPHTQEHANNTQNIGLGAQTNSQSDSYWKHTLGPSKQRDLKSFSITAVKRLNEQLNIQTTTQTQMTPSSTSVQMS